VAELGVGVARDLGCAFGCTCGWAGPGRTRLGWGLGSCVRVWAVHWAGGLAKGSAVVWWLEAALGWEGLGARGWGGGWAGCCAGVWAALWAGMGLAEGCGVLH
jgi:hypothetical protein